jgi:hypothetical protein
MSRRRLSWTAMAALSALAVALVVGSANAAFAQDETRIGAEFRRETEEVRENCAAITKLTGCAMTIATGHPLHVAFGTIAPGNGVAIGAAFGTSYAPNESWRVTWSGDGVAAFGGSWRAGAYAKFIHTPNDVITVVTSPANVPAPGTLAVRPSAVIGLFAQTTSLQRMHFFGSGPNSARDQLTVFGMRQSVIGASLVAPLSNARAARVVNLAVVGEASGRFVDLRDGVESGVPTTAAIFDDLAAPGLMSRAGFLQLGEGVRISPSLAGDHVRLNYLALAQQFLTSSKDASSFRRYRLDLRHEIPLYGHSSGAQSRDFNSPNDCGSSPGANKCPAISHDRYGTLTARILFVTSAAGTGKQVPIYFQPTLGGSDVNGQATLASYDDSRFRAPNVLLFQQTFEMSVWRMIGAWLQTDEGTVGMARSDLSSSFKHSVSVGLTVRAGGFPMMVVSYATGGPEGHHITATISTSLLGGSSRPPLD